MGFVLTRDYELEFNVVYLHHICSMVALQLGPRYNIHLLYGVESLRWVILWTSITLFTPAMST